MAKKAILIIIDCYALNCLVNTVLSNDFDIFSAQSCAEAIKYLQSNLNLKAIVIDISDITAENLTLLEHINSSSILRNIKTVVISNSNDESFKNNALEMGSLLFLTKPFDPVYLSNSLKSSLNSGNTSWSIKRSDLSKTSNVSGEFYQ